MSASHRMLERQLRVSRAADGDLDVGRLIELVGETYAEHERDLRRINRANSLMAEELQEMLAIREQAANERAARIEEMERAQTALAASEARAMHLAYHDALTGLPNRALLHDRLGHALENARRNGHPFAVHCIDLDHFKAVNDTFGHLTGDEMIRTAADRLSSVCRKSDTLARLGGDEFAVVQLGVAPGQAAALAARIVEMMAQPVELSVGHVHIGCSIGVTHVSDAGIEPMETLRQADLALYRVKDQGRGGFAFFEPEMDAAVRTRRALQQDLRDALRSGDIDLHFQPQFNADGRLIGAEALARWTHAERGDVSPGVFVPIAEECGLVVDLGWLVLRKAFAYSARWPGLKLAVNISAHQLRMPDFVAKLEALVAEVGVCPRDFELEITEGVLLGDDHNTKQALLSLRTMGFTLALDDFGTGYSSLSYLQRYPIDMIKIDRSFVTNLGANPEAEAVVSAIIKLARALNLRVMAEGVETRTQYRALLAAGCAEAQGYLFGRPMPAPSIDAMLERTRAPAVA